MSYELHWRNGDSKGWIDVLPERFFAEPQRDAVHNHRCVKPGSGSLVALCILNSDDQFLHLTYPRQEADVHPGTTRIPVQDGRPQLGVEIGWADPGDQSFAWRHAEWGEPPLLEAAPADAETRLERQALTRVRDGQDEFRRGLDRIWSSACALTGVTQREVLRASHITPWREANGRLDPSNGLLLAAHVDALFDRHSITFDGDGVLHWSPNISRADRDRLGLPARLSKVPDAGQAHFLRQHNAGCEWFEDRPSE